MKHPIYFFLLFALSLCALDGASARVTLDSGEHLIGEVLPQSNDETLVVQSSLLGQLKVPRSRVLSITVQTENKEAPANAPAATPPAKPEATPAPSPTSPTAAEAFAEEKKIIDTLREFKAPDTWSGNLRLGINISDGDRKWAETYTRGKLEIKPKKSPSFYRFTGSYTYRESERSDGSKFKSTDRYDAEFIYRRTFLGRLVRPKCDGWPCRPSQGDRPRITGNNRGRVSLQAFRDVRIIGRRWRWYRGL
jgi:hypothetical protein